MLVPLPMEDVFLGYASRYGRALIDRALYLPESWTADAARRTEAGVPEEIVVATKPSWVWPCSSGRVPPACLSSG